MRFIFVLTGIGDINHNLILAVRLKCKNGCLSKEDQFINSK